MRVLWRLAGWFPALVATSVAADDGHAARRYDAQSIALARSMIVADAPAPAGVVDLKFGEFFKMPAGRYGLEPTERLTGLDGERVRMVGYVVGQDTPSPGRFILAPFRLTLATAADGPADDLPPATAWVGLPAAFQRADLPPVPVPVVVIGTLRVGPAPEQHGRVSFVRIEMDADDPRLPDSVDGVTPAEGAVVAEAKTSNTDREQ